VSDESQGTDLPETVAIDAQEAESSPAIVETPEVEEPKKTPWFQKRIDELTAARRDAERREAALNDRLMGLLEQQRPTEPEKPTGKPVLESFESYEDYTEALTDWKVDQKLTQVEQRRQAETAAETAAREQAEFNSRVQKTAAKAPEVLELVNDATLPVSAAMASVIKTVENGPDVLIYLGSNREEAARIAQLPAHLAAYEMGRLSTALTPVEKPKRNQPPAPITPLGGGSAASVEPEAMTDAQFNTWRRAQIAQRGKH
jgi:hypothetical protein